MFGRKGRILLVIITFCGVFLLSYFLNQAYLRKNTATMEVVMVTKKVPPYSLLSKEDLAVMTIPQAIVPDDAVLDLEEFWQDSPYYTTDLGFGAGDLLCTEKLSSDHFTAWGKMAALTNEESMLIAINTNLVQSCANLVIPGSLVEAIVHLPAKGMEEEDQVISCLEEPALANLLVVDKKNAQAAPIEKDSREAIPAVVVLKLHKNQQTTAKKLVYYNEKGTIYLLPVGFRSEIFAGWAVEG
ncbi:MAG TPA: Flp pilus assembly protein CpaB [Clostridia bacterium]|jgi:Flp pilus assembly protein CpaB|nr:Flp pilus assembly protein CpaB [Clostridia bacterium]